MADRGLTVRQVADRAAEVREICWSKASLARKGTLLQDLRVLESKLDECFGSGPYYRIDPATREAWDAFVAALSPEEKTCWTACLLSDLIAQAPERLSHIPMPKSILPHV